jgi:hypothetical protein
MWYSVIRKQRVKHKKYSVERGTAMHNFEVYEAGIFPYGCRCYFVVQTIDVATQIVWDKVSWRRQNWNCAHFVWYHVSYIFVVGKVLLLSTTTLLVGGCSVVEKYLSHLWYYAACLLGLRLSSKDLFILSVIISLLDSSDLLKYDTTWNKN